MRALAAGLVLAGLLAGPADGEGCRGCGCAGGPGYRTPGGRCASWRTLAKLCGRPPETRCTAEIARGPGAAEGPRRRRGRARPERPTMTVPNPFLP